LFRVTALPLASLAERETRDEFEPLATLLPSCFWRRAGAGRARQVHADLKG
jgi:hypothetical protein